MVIMKISIKKIFFFLFTLLFPLLGFAIGGPVEDSPDLGLFVDFSVPKTSVYFKKKIVNGSLVRGISFRGNQIQRTENKTIYLFIRDEKGNKEALCRFEGGNGVDTFSGPSFPSCYLKSSRIFQDEGRSYGILNILHDGGNYSLFFSSKRDGSDRVSQEVDIGKAYFISDQVMDIDVSLIEKGEKKFYRFNAEVLEDGDPGKELFVNLYNENGNKVEIFSLPFQAGQKVENLDFDLSNLSSRNYIGKIEVENNGRLETIQTFRPKPVDNSSSNENQNLSTSSSSGSVSDIATMSSLYGGQDTPKEGEGIVPTDCGYNLKKGGRMCTLNDFIRLLRRAISYIFILILPIMAIVTAYVGYILLTKGSNPEKRKEAKERYLALLKGIVLFLAAWLIVKLIVEAIGLRSDFNIFFGS